MKRLGVFLVALSFVVAATVLLLGNFTGPSIRTTNAQANISVVYWPVADARVSEAEANRNFAVDPKLRTDGAADPEVESYLMFSIGDLAGGTVTSAVLRVFATSSSGDGPIFYAADPAWTEDTITWNNRTARTSDVLGETGAVSSGNWIEIDVTGVVTGNGVYSFSLATDSTDGTDMSSRDGANPPELVLTFEDPAPIPTDTATSPPPPTDTEIAPTYTEVPPTVTPPPTDTPVPTDTETSTPLPPTDTPAPPPTDTPVPGSVLSTPAADAMVSAAEPNRNFGSSARLRVDGGGDPAVESYLTFVVSNSGGAVTSATLRVFATTDSRNGPAAYAGDVNWAEGTITWANRPPRISDVLDDVGAVPASSWIELDVTGVVSGDGTYTFVLATNSADGTNMSSREGGNKPQLVLTIGNALPTATEEAVPTATTTRTVAPTATATRTPVSGGSAVVLAAGDIASCGSSGDEATGDLVASEPGSVLVLGDLAYESGTTQQFNDCYDPSWGPVKNRTYPSPGNHEYQTAGAAGYYNYFGAAAGDPRKGYYSFDLGSWHVVSLNSNCAQIGGCGAGSPQEQWLRADLAANPNTCTLAYWHHPLYSSGLHGNHPSVRALWQALYDYNAELVLSGHDHHYERFRPQTANGASDPDRGIREFVVGTGGKSHYAIEAVQPNSEVRDSSTYGVLRLTLRTTGYDWRFLPVGGAFSDSGSGGCHDANGLVSGQGSDLAAMPHRLAVAVMPEN